MADLECKDERILAVCAEMFNLLKSGETEGTIHRKETSVRTFSTGSKSVSLSIGFLNFQMIWKPIKMTSLGTSGSDEGASVFITLPFFEGSTENIIKTAAYYSERTNNRTLTVIDFNHSKSKEKKRVIYSENVSIEPPIK